MDSRINPKITDLDIGTRTLTKIKIYPLSLHDQMELGDVVTNALKEFFSQQGNQEIKQIDMVSFILDLIQLNLKRLLPLITDVPEVEGADTLLKNMTNDQAVAIVRAVFEQNYADALKNGMSLFKEILATMTQTKKQEPMKRQSRPSSKDTRNTASNTSSDSGSAPEV